MATGVRNGCSALTELDVPAASVAMPASSALASTDGWAAGCDELAERAGTLEAGVRGTAAGDGHVLGMSLTPLPAFFSLKEENSLREMEWMGG